MTTLYRKENQGPHKRNSQPKSDKQKELRADFRSSDSAILILWLFFKTLFFLISILIQHRHRNAKILRKTQNIVKSPLIPRLWASCPRKVGGAEWWGSCEHCFAGSCLLLCLTRLWSWEVTKPPSALVLLSVKWEWGGTYSQGGDEKEVQWNLQNFSHSAWQWTATQ